ncbi:MAG TPA: glycoside hydrolase, partial [Crocinitomicaceae bacterium]|nr:glycoside hydrolase [Crocinitomicaceae bacterium]
MQNVLFFFLAFLFFSCQSQVSNELEKINGVNLVSENELLNQNQITPLLGLKSNYAAVIPFSFMPAVDNPNLTFDSKWQWKGEKVHGTIESIQLLHKNGVKVMI